jgi:hypothetical protein
VFHRLFRCNNHAELFFPSKNRFTDCKYSNAAGASLPRYLFFRGVPQGHCPDSTDTVDPPGKQKVRLDVGFYSGHYALLFDQRDRLLVVGVSGCRRMDG